jgi:hypothetical protein
MGCNPRQAGSTPLMPRPNGRRGIVPFAHMDEAFCRLTRRLSPLPLTLATRRSDSSLATEAARATVLKVSGPDADAERQAPKETVMTEINKKTWRAGDEAQMLDYYRDVRQEYLEAPASLSEFLNERWKVGMAIVPGWQVVPAAMVECSNCGKPLDYTDHLSCPVIVTGDGQHKYVCAPYCLPVGM